MPCNVFVDSDGTVAAVGAVTPEELELATRRLLGPDALIDAPEDRAWHWEKEPDHIARHIAGWEAFRSTDVVDVDDGVAGAG